MTNSDQNAVTTEAASTLEALKEKARLLDITFHPSIGVEKLRAKVDAKLGQVMPTVAAIQQQPDVIEHKQLTEAQLERKRLNDARKDAARLMRIVVSCMNPAKTAWEGEIFVAGSTLLGTHKKFIPFNNDEGWHVPKIIVTMLEERQCQVFYDGKDTKGRKIKMSKLIPEFNIQYLDPLTVDQIDALAKKQAMANNLG